MFCNVLLDWTFICELIISIHKGKVEQEVSNVHGRVFKPNYKTEYNKNGI